MKKRVFSALLAFCLAFSLIGTALAATAAETAEASASEPASETEAVDTETADTADAVEAEETGDAEAVAEETAEETADAGTDAEAAALPDGAAVPDGYTRQYTVRDEANGFAVTVYAPEGVVPEGAALSASLLSEGDDAYAEAETALLAETPEVLSEDGEEEASYGFAALDIHFEDAGGNEVEPNGNVYVVIDAAGLLPESADPDTVTVQHHAETDGAVTVETVADAADETDGVVAVTGETAVQAAFEVDSFSTFTIRWNSSNALTVYIIDTNGNHIGTSSLSLGSTSISSATSISNIVAEIEEQVDGTLNNYTFSKAVVARNSTSANSSSTQVQRIQRSGSDWQYSTSATGSSWSNIGNNNSIFLIYSTSLTTVETVDSTAEGVHMYMFNYSGAAFSGGNYTENNRTGDVKEGLASTLVNSNGWPTLTGTYSTSRGTSFSTFFGGTTSAYDLSGTLTNSGQEVNHLFLQSYYNEDGTFYYSSFENFATLANDNDSDFTVYAQLGSPDASTNYYYRRGNFLPYNTLNLSNIINYNLYDYLGQELDSDDARYNEPIYGVNGTVDYYFGMYIWADFYQPEDGEVESNTANENGTVDTSDMVFEFTGDDDMWVYIDGVLVLDLGGIHDAQSGYINFATGEVGYTDNVSGESETWYFTNLKTIFTSAGVATSYDWDGNTFKDGSSHRIQIFYMERGAGASNLKISFNLKTIPDGQLAVTKDVENYYAPQISDVTYTMQVEVYNEDTGTWVAYANQAYTLMGDESNTYYTDSNGQFTIKNDETALFPDIDVDTQVRVSEVGSSDTSAGATISQNYSISYTITDSGGSSIDGSSNTGGCATASMPAYGSINVTVTNTATYTRPLQLVKNFSGTEDGEAPEDFEATYTLSESSDGGITWVVVGSIKYSDMTNGTYTFWLDVDKTYKIEETFETGDSKGDTEALVWNSVTVTTNDPADGTNASEGIVCLETSDATSGDDVDTITMTNNYGSPMVTLTVSKTVSGGMGDTTKKFSFELTLTKGEGEDKSYYTGSLSVKGESQPLTANNNTYTFTLKHNESIEIEVPSGYTATVTETDSGSYTVSTRNYAADTETADVPQYSENKTASVSVTMTENYIIDFLNELEPVPPTGIDTGSTAPYVVLTACAAFAGAALAGSAVAVRLRRRRQE